MLKVISVTGTIASTLWYTQYNSSCKDKLLHPGRRFSHKFKPWDDNWDFMKPELSSNISDEVTAVTKSRQKQVT